MPATPAQLRREAAAEGRLQQPGITVAQVLERACVTTAATTAANEFAVAVAGAAELKWRPMRVG